MTDNNARQPARDFTADDKAADHEHEKRKSSRPSMQSVLLRIKNDNDMRRAMDAAFEYRGDVSILLDDDSVITGFVFDRRHGETPESSVLRVIPTKWKADTEEKITITCDRVQAIKFSGRDAADGLTWEAWVERYRRKQQQKAGRKE